MITRLKVRNFQKHRELVAKIGPGITAIVGDTDRGKSSIMRALIWVLTNEPNGKQFITHGTPGASVTLEIDGHVLKRSRGEGKVNTYTLDGKVFRAFGASVPEEIAHFLQVSELNFQPQHSRAFWFHLTGPEVVRQLNAIVDLSVIDLAQKKISTARRTAQAHVEFTTSRLSEAAKAVAELHEVDAFANDAEHLVTLEGAIAEISHKREQLTALVTRASEARQKSRAIEVPDLLPTDNLILEVEEHGSRLDLLREHLQKTFDAKARATVAEIEQTKAEQALGNLKGCGCPVCGQPLP